MVQQGPVNQVNYENFDHYRYPQIIFYDLSLTYPDIIDSASLPLLLPNSIINGAITSGGVSLIVPPMQNRIIRLVFRATIQIRIPNTLNTGVSFPFSAELTNWGNIGPLPLVNIDGSPLSGFTGVIDYVDFGPQVSRVNLPSLYVNYGLSASDFDTTVFNPSGGVGAVLIVVTTDIYGYSPKMVPPTLI